jgi:hypothetical protein
VKERDHLAGHDRFGDLRRLLAIRCEPAAAASITPLPQVLGSHPTGAHSAPTGWEAEGWSQVPSASWSLRAFVNCVATS